MKYIDTTELERLLRDPGEARRELLGDFKWEPPHPAPWTVNGHTSSQFGRRTTVWVISDAKHKCVAEFEDRYTAEWVASEWNARHQPPQDQTPGSEPPSSTQGDRNG